MTNAQQFPLYDLFWWQNPWYWLALFGAIVLGVFFVGIAFWWWHRWHKQSPQERILNRLQQLADQCAVQQGDAKVLYGEIMLLIKQFAVLEHFVSTDVVTDREFLVLMEHTQTLGVAPFVSSIKLFVMDGEQVKFAEQTVDWQKLSEQLRSCLTACQTYLALVQVTTVQGTKVRSTKRDAIQVHEQ